MKLTTKSEYALLSLIYLARKKDNKLLKIEDISKKYRLSKKYLEQILIILKQNRYIFSKRGASGGYGLKVDPKDISIAEIIRLMDGAIAPVESVSEYFFSNTPLEQEKKITKLLKKIRDYISKKLENITIYDLI